MTSLYDDSVWWFQLLVRVCNIGFSKILENHCYLRERNVNASGCERTMSAFWTECSIAKHLMFIYWWIKKEYTFPSRLILRVSFWHWTGIGERYKLATGLHRNFFNHLEDLDFSEETCWNIRDFQQKISSIWKGVSI